MEIRLGDRYAWAEKTGEIRIGVTKPENPNDGYYAGVFKYTRPDDFRCIKADPTKYSMLEEAAEAALRLKKEYLNSN